MLEQPSSFDVERTRSVYSQAFWGQHRQPARCAPRIADAMISVPHPMSLYIARREIARYKDECASLRARRSRSRCDTESTSASDFDFRAQNLRPRHRRHR